MAKHIHIHVGGKAVKTKDAQREVEVAKSSVNSAIQDMMKALKSKDFNPSREREFYQMIKQMRDIHEKLSSW